MDVTPSVSAFLSKNRGPDATSIGKQIQPDYGVKASLIGNDLDLAITFKTGSSYCCMEYSCHLNLVDGKRWDRLRKTLVDHNVMPPDRIQLRLSCVIESGALFFDMSRPETGYHGWYAFKPAEALEYESLATECD